MKRSIINNHDISINHNNEVPNKIPRHEKKEESENNTQKGGMPRRGGLQRRFRILEPNLQPSEIVEKTGDMGNTVRLQSNFAKFSILKSAKFNMYDTVFAEPGMSPRSKLALLIEIAQKHQIPGAFCYDGRRLFTSEDWHSEFEIQEYSIDNRKVSLIFLTHIHPNTEEYYQMINIVLNNLQVMLGQEKINRAYFLSANIMRNEVPRSAGPTYFEMNNFKVLGGFGTTLQRGTTREGVMTTLLHIERINRVMNDNSVVKIYNRRSIDQLIGRDIITKHNNKTYRISDIKEMSTEEKFEMNERTLTYAEYFKERYNIKLQHANQPFVITRVKRPIKYNEKKEGETTRDTRPDDISLNIPGELCFLCGFSDQEKSNLDLQKGMVSVLKREPRERLKDIPAFCEWIGNGEASSAMCRQWQLKIDNRPLEIEGRELPQCDVISNNKKINDKIADDWKFGRVQFDIKPDRAHEIYVIVIDRNDFNYKNFINDVENELKNMRINARIRQKMSCGPNDVEKCLTDAMRDGSNAAKMALVFVPDDRTYARVKTFTMQTGLLTQCVTTRNGTNKNDKRRQVVSSKTVVQIFSKFGYDPWTVSIKLRPTMIVGMDTYHNKTSKKSIQASVFSINNAFTQYMSFVNAPKGRQEFHETLGQNFITALSDFKKRYDILPQRIIVYRDGVGDSQLSFTKSFEIDALKPIIVDIYKAMGNGPPQIVYIIVKKRISTKLFNRGNNPNPGTIVDKEIVKPNYYEFFLVSQRTLKGTASPTNYNVLEDSKLMTKKGTMEPIPPNELQKITYALTHLYFNWMGTIRVPVPVHYAHRLAELVGKVHKGSSPPMIHDRIKSRLFYL